MIFNKVKRLVPLAGVALMLGTSCSKSTFDVNKNPNQATDSTVSYDVILPSVLDNTGRIIATQWGFLQNWMGYWARSGTYAPNVAEETYTITTSFGNGIWNSCYDNLYDYDIMINKATRANAVFYAGIGRIMKAHNYQILVDVYGNVPYSQALKGNSNTTPKYDKGLDIYKDLFRQIDTGIALIKSSTKTLADAKVATNDIMFQGDQTKWAKFGNTLKLRMILHAYRVSGFDITGEIAKIVSQGDGYLGVDQTAAVNPGYTGTSKANPFYNAYKFNSDGTQAANDVYYRANDWGIGYYNGDHDPRVSRFYAAGANGLTGVKYGLPAATSNAAANLAGIGPGVAKTATSSQQVITSAESFFLQAEARIRGYITTGATAAALLNSGMLESMKYLGVTDPAGSLTTYQTYNAGYADVDITTTTPVATGLPIGGIFTVLSQKWFALNATNTLETWTDYRRVDYNTVATKTGAATDHFVYGEGAGYTPGPPLSVAPQNTSTKIPVRLLYPQTEYNYNGTNATAEGSINQFTSRIFWDIN